MNEIAIIGDEDAVLGFRMAGVQQAFVVSEEKLSEQVNAVKDATMLIVTEAAAELIDKKNLREKINATMIEVPSKSGSKGLAKQRLADLFESAIGVKLKR